VIPGTPLTRPAATLPLNLCRRFVTAVRGQQRSGAAASDPRATRRLPIAGTASRAPSAAFGRPCSLSLPLRRGEGRGEGFEASSRLAPFSTAKWADAAKSLPATAQSESATPRSGTVTCQSAEAMTRSPAATAPSPSATAWPDPATPRPAPALVRSDAAPARSVPGIARSQPATPQSALATPRSDAANARSVNAIARLPTTYAGLVKQSQTPDCPHPAPGRCW
jgi:hypothetical protein